MLHAPMHRTLSLKTHSVVVASCNEGYSIVVTFRVFIVILMPRVRNATLVTGLVAFAAAGMAFPFYMASSRTAPVINSSKALPPQANFRGPYINTGSRDVGPDNQIYSKK